MMVSAGARAIATNEKTCKSTAYRLEVPLNHSQMLKARRRKQKAKKHLAGAAKRAKKLRKQNVKMISADALEKHSP